MGRISHLISLAYLLGASFNDAFEIALVKTTLAN